MTGAAGIRPARPGSAGPRPGSQPVLSGASPGTPWLAFGSLLASTVAAAVLVVTAWRDDAGLTPDVSVLALAGWLIGSVAGLMLFAWFRAIDARNRADRWFVEPRWRPARLALVVAVIGWILGVLAAVMVAQSLARR